MMMMNILTYHLRALKKQGEDRIKSWAKEYKDYHYELLSDFKKETKDMSKEELALHKDAEKKRNAEIKLLPKKER